MSLCLIVLGMHRSGTSAITGVLNILGAELGKDLLPPTLDNPKGFFENKEINYFNEFVLMPALKTTWDDLNPIDEDSIKDRLKNFYKEGKNIVLSNFSNSKICAVKDPRLCILFPFWEDIFTELGFKIKIVVPIRHPVEVAQSLMKRNKMPLEKGILLWMKYNLMAEYYSRKYKRIFIKFNDLLNNPEETIKRIGKALNIKFPKTYETVRNQIENFLDENLKHHTAELEVLPDYIPSYVKELYSFLFKGKRKNYAQLDKLRKAYKEAVEFYNMAFALKERKFKVNYYKENIKDLLDFFVIDIINFSFINKKISIGGLACLKSKYNPEDFEILLKTRNGTYTAKWKIPSPFYAQKNPKNPNSKNARFSVEIETTDEFVIFLRIKRDSKALLNLAEGYLI